MGIKNSHSTRKDALILEAHIIPFNLLYEFISSFFLHSLGINDKLFKSNRNIFYGFLFYCLIYDSLIPLKFKKYIFMKFINSSSLTPIIKVCIKMFSYFISSIPSFKFYDRFMINYWIRVRIFQLLKLCTYLIFFNRNFKLPQDFSNQTISKIFKNQQNVKNWTLFPF